MPRLSTTVEAARKSVAAVLADEESRIKFDDLRSRDGNQAIRAGALLGFSALLLAAQTVQLSAEPGTLLNIPLSAHWAAICVSLGVVASIVAGLLALWSILHKGDYRKTKKKDLLQNYEAALDLSDTLLFAANLLSLLVCGLVLVTLVHSILANGSFLGAMNIFRGR
ncbi:MAG: hypothetical protein ABW199_01640 [Caulobacterales bacterium]